MHLKTVEIVGFKSFADKTRIELKPGITGIVGPNGCGKSNVMEAIRWCIGEMSWKSLRSPSMVDVIFNGNTRRSPMGLAEVTLTFDNSSSLLPVQYTEVTVARRIFRSGESEYLLNRTPCRLRDIRELFLDTGIGGDGYAIIDQGGVDFVLNSKPQDRRSLFEEAAGVSKYRAKREEALRKLERVEADLARLQDSIALITEQIKKLDSDARRARLYQKYKDELTAQEAALILKELGQIEGELAGGSARTAPVLEALGAARTSLDAEGARLAALRLERAQADAQNAELNRELAEIKTEIGRLEERIESGRRMTQELSARGLAAQGDLAHEEERLEALGPEMEGALATLEQAAAMRDSANSQRDEFHAQLQVLTAGIQEAQGHASAGKADVLAAVQASVEASNHLRRLEGLTGNQTYEAGASLKDLGRRQSKAEALRCEIDAHLAKIASQQGWVDDGRKAMTLREGALEALKAEAAALAEESLAARTESAVLEARVEALEREGGQDPYWVGAQAVAGADLPGVIGTLRSLIRVPSGLEPAAEDVLGGRLDSVVVETLDAARRALDFIEAAGKGRARLLVLSAVPEDEAPGGVPDNAKPLAQQVQWDPRIERAGRWLLSECFSLGGRTYGPQWVCGGSSHGAEPASFEDVAFLRGRIEESKARQGEVSSRRAGLESKVAETDAAVRAAAVALQEETGRLHGLDAQRREMESRLSSISEESELLTQEAMRLLAEIAKTKEDLLGARASVEEARVREEEARRREGEVSERLERLKGEFTVRREQEGRLEAAARQCESQYQLTQQQQARLAGEEEGLKAAAARRRSDIEETARRQEEIAREGAQAAARLDELHRELAAGEGTAQEMALATRELALSAETLEKAIEALQAERRRLEEELHAWEVQASGLKSRREALEARLSDEWQLTAEEARAKFPAVEPDPEKVQTLRRRIQGMGNINMAAPEEYEALTQKNSFFMSQVEDLIKAKDDLRAAITKINATTREHFRQTFTEVREHFRRIYGTLFEGGEADLLLTDPENLLETGVEIMAQPPGKRLQSITLLSGGERTLTAIALLFAFFMVRPSPVCMLDEADAALDEANINRFVAMLREFTQKSQFLIISHNKRTMEASDQMYGVTMEESGISVIISVDFKKKSAVDGSDEADPRGSASVGAPA